MPSSRGRCQLLAAFLALVAAAVVRYLARLAEDRHLRPSADDSEPLVIYGAGHAGVQIARTLLRTRDSPLRPVALLDDDPHKARMQCTGCA